MQVCLILVFKIRQIGLHKNLISVKCKFWMRVEAWRLLLFNVLVSQQALGKVNINVFHSQQARRGTNYKLYIEHWYVYETRRMFEQLWKLCSGMLLWPFPPLPPCGRLFPFWCWWHQCGWMYQNMWRSWFHACGTQVGLLDNLDTTCVLTPRDRQFCHCGNVEPPTEFIRGWDMCGTACPPTPMSPPPDLGIVEACGTSLHTMVSFILMNFSSTCTP